MLPVGRTATPPAVVDDVLELVWTAIVPGVLWEEDAMHEDIETQAYPFAQHPPPISTGQAWAFVEHGRVVWRPVYVFSD